MFQIMRRKILWYEYEGKTAEYRLQDIVAEQHYSPDGDTLIGGATQCYCYCCTTHWCMILVDYLLHNHSTHYVRGPAPLVHWCVTILLHHIWTRTSWWGRKIAVHHVGLGAPLIGAQEKLVHPSMSQAAMY